MPASNADPTWINVALTIGRRLAGQAQWSNGECTWMVTRGDRDDRDRPMGVRESANAMVYQGAAGIGLFLSELFGVTGDLEVKRAANGAAEFVMRRLDTMPANAFGVFSGRTGAAYTLIRHGLLTGNEQAIEIARQGLITLAKHADEDPGLDVITGAAGAIPVFLRVRELLEAPEFLDVAVRLGRRIVKVANRGLDGWSWFAGTPGAQFRNLTGFAHGASGYAVALFELAASTGRAEFLIAAQEALAYERAAFVQAESQWMDYRCQEIARRTRDGESTRALQRDVRRGTYQLKVEAAPMFAWCHGAPGIGLARARAFELTRDASIAAEFELATAVTANQLPAAIGNYSLCHGATGNAETLIEFERITGSNQFRPVLNEVAAWGARRWGERNLPFPSGTVAAVPEASLMLGDAGIGLFYLRLASSQVPSILLIRGHTSEPAVISTENVRIARREIISHWFGNSLDRCAKITDDARNLADITPDNNTSVIASVYRRIWPLLNGASTSNRRRFVEELAVPIACYKVERAHCNHVEEFIDELARRGPGEVDWSVARILPTRRCRAIRGGISWATSQTKDLGMFAIFRYRQQTQIQQLTPFGYQVLKSCRRGIKLADLQREIAQRVTSEGSGASDRVFSATRLEVERQVRCGLLALSMPYAST